MTKALFVLSFLPLPKNFRTCPLLFKIDKIRKLVHLVFKLLSFQVHSKIQTLDQTYHQSDTQFCAQNDFRTRSRCSFGPVPLLNSCKWQWQKISEDFCAKNTQLHK